MDILIGIILIISYFALIVYAAKGKNLMIGFFIMAILWALLAWIGGEITLSGILNDVIQSGAESWGPTAVNVIFGSWFGRVLIETGIASKLIKAVTELGGDNLYFVTILLSIVTAIIFTATFGAGAVVAIGVIILPIMMSLGISQTLSVTTYLMSVGAGMYLNGVLFSQMQAIFPSMEFDSQYQIWGALAMLVQLVVIAIMVRFNSRSRKGSRRRRAWAMQAPKTDEAPEDNVPGYALLTPIIPTFLAIFFSWPTIPAFIAGGLYGMGTCGMLNNFEDISRNIPATFYNGVKDVASLLGFLFILPMFNTVSGIVAPFFETIIGPFVPKTNLGLAIFFIILAPLGLFRGPLTIFGAGAATVGVLEAVGNFSVPILFTFMYVPTISMNLSVCPTQSWNMWALNYSKVSVKELLSTGFIWAWIISAINLLLAYFIFG